MARRASSSIQPAAIAALVIVVVAIVLGGKWLTTKKGSSFGDVAKLDVQELLLNGNSLRGNEYAIEGQVDQKLRWTAASGQVVSVRVVSDGVENFIGIEIPPELSKVNVEIKQRYAFRVKFRQGGIPVATAIDRI
ncbi:MAG: hypothetical protein QM627_14030 [Luteolibacter sp.]